MKNKVTKNKTNKDKIIKKTELEEKKQEESNEISKIEKGKEKNKNKIKRNLVIIVLIIALLIIYVVQRGEYLEIKEIGENYISIFWKNFRSMAITTIINFMVVFTLMNITSKKIKNGLKTFFEDEHKQMPKLPQKSISFIVATLVSIFTSNYILTKALLCFNSTKFVITDPALGKDIGYYVFILPFIKLIVMYALIAIVALAVYSVLYYLIVFNICFEGISRETVKKSEILNHVLTTLKVLIILIAALVLVETQNIGVQKFITLNSDESENYSLYGAGSTEIYIRFAAYILLAFVIIFSLFRAIKQFKKKNTKKIIKNILIVPAYLLIVVAVMIAYNLIFVNSNELDKEKKYISDNIKYTKLGYDIDIEDVKAEDGGTITESEITENSDTVNNIPIVNSDTVLKDLNISLTNNDYYKYSYTNKAVYSIDGKNQLVFLTPREIASNNSAYTNKTYEYTHGYGIILTLASKTTTNGNLNHIQKSFEDSNESVSITQPRIYFGRETNNTVVTNSNSKKEFDYPLDSSTNEENSYDGDAGLELNLLDRIVLAIKEKDPKLAFSGSVKSDSRILTNRNIINRAKTIMPYLTYDDDPYMVVTNSGELIWVLDAYTTSNNYPYSQRTILENNGISKSEINYIRNSVKVIINAYNGDVTFYITDKSDPIAAAYKKIYPDLFSEETIPEDISSHFVYPSYLYKIQSEIIARYHNIEADDLYRSEDVWTVATHNTSQVLSKTGTEISPYYTMVKTTDSSNSRLGLVLPYTPYGKENITAYLVGSVDENGNNVLKTYTYSKDSNVVGPMQLDTQIAQDETISKELESVNVTGTKITKDIVIVPVNNTLLYIEPIYQQYINEADSLPTLKKVIVASGSKVTVGNTLSEALSNLISQNAVELEVENTDNVSDLVNAIIRANNNLKASTQSSDWTQIGKDTQKLQDLITKIEEVKTKEDEKVAQNAKDNTNTVNDIVSDENTIQ